MKKTKCLYCENLTDDPHFISDCCGRGMCGECFDSGVGTDKQLQVSCSSENIKEEYQDAEYLCFDCADIWQDKERSKNETV